MNKFYTYMYLRQDGTPYYVGKGSGDRAFKRHDRQSSYHTPPEKARITIQYWVDEETAFEMEKYYIRLFGRKDNGTGILINFTDGGDGISGLKHTSEAKQKMREHAIAWGFGVVTKHGMAVPLGSKRPKMSEEWRDNIRKSMMGHGVADVTRAKMKAVPHPKAKGELGAHSRWHVQRNTVNPECTLCLQ